MGRLTGHLREPVRHFGEMFDMWAKNETRREQTIEMPFLRIHVDHDVNAARNILAAFRVLALVRVYATLSCVYATLSIWQNERYLRLCIVVHNVMYPATLSKTSVEIVAFLASHHIGK